MVRYRDLLSCVAVIGMLLALSVGMAPPAEAALTCKGKRATIVARGGGPTVGTNGNDVIVGTSGADVIDAGPGHDRICTGGGDDSLYGGPGRDSLLGGGGDDFLYGDGCNKVRNCQTGTTGNDTLNGGGGTYDWATFVYSTTANLAGGTATGTEGSDTLSGLENLQGSSEDDTLIGDAGSNLLWGAEGKDSLWGRAGDDVLEGGDDNDDMFGGAGAYDYASYYFTASSPVEADLAKGEASSGIFHDQLNDIEAIVGGPHDDVIFGDVGQNYLLGGPGNDQLNGRHGTDMAVFYLSDAPVTASLAQGNASGEGTDRLFDIEGLWGTDAAAPDTLTGDGGANFFIGGLGDDQMLGGAGDDYFYDDGGNDVIDGEAGTYDMVDFIFATAAVEADLGAGTMTVGEETGTLRNVEALVGTEFDDIFRGNDAINYLFGEGGNDLIFGLGGDDGLEGGGDLRDSTDGGAGSDRCIAAERIACESELEAERHPLVQQVSGVGRLRSHRPVSP